MTGAPLTNRKILRFWLPLASTWLMMALEGPYLAAIIARMSDATINLAAFGIAFAFAVIIESPVIMLMTASTALVEDRQSYFALRRFSYGLSATLTLVQVLLLGPPIFNFVAHELLRLPPDVARLTYGGLVWLLPWTLAIGYRRFKQGLLIRRHLTRRIVYGTVLRLATMSLTALAAYHWLTLPGAHLGALALSTGVIAEAIASHMMTRKVIPEILRKQEKPKRLKELSFGVLVRFYTPLALTSLIAMAGQPLVTFFMGQSRYALESLAVIPVIHGLTFIFRAIGLSYLEVVVALMSEHREYVRAILVFGGLIGVCTVTGLSLIAFTPLAVVWFHNISGLTTELTVFALTPVRILAVFPMLSVLLAMQRGFLVYAHQNQTITWSTVVEILSVVIVLAIGIHQLNLIGATAAAIAILSGRLIGALFLVAPSLNVVRGSRNPDGKATTKPMVSQ